MRRNQPEHISELESAISEWNKKYHQSKSQKQMEYADAVKINLMNKKHTEENNPAKGTDRLRDRNTDKSTNTPNTTTAPNTDTSNKSIGTISREQHTSEGKNNILIPNMPQIPQNGTDDETWTIRTAKPANIPTQKNFESKKHF